MTGNKQIPTVSGVYLKPWVLLPVYLSTQAFSKSTLLMFARVQSQANTSANSSALFVLGSFARAVASSPKYNVITEALIYHAKKIVPSDPEGRDRPEVSADPYSPQLQYVIKRAKALDIPVVLHIESRSLAPERKLELWRSLEKLMRENPQVSFVYTHLAQLDSKDILKLLNKHENIYFFLQLATLTEHKSFSRNPFERDKWTCVFCEKPTCNKGDLKPEWEKLFLDHPKRFIFAMDGVEWPIWRYCYEDAVREWKIAISKLPKHVGRKIAHENAERLWHMKPLY